MRVVVFDYGRVITHDQSVEDKAALVALAGCPPEVFWEAYWEFRDAYDLGNYDGHGYWERVAAQIGVELDETRRAALIEADCASWSRLNPHITAWIQELRGSGVVLGLLSNAASEIRDAVLGRAEDGLLFEATVFSCDLGRIKPDPQVYREILGRLRASPHEALFIDDKPENVEGAREVGMVAIRFETVEALARDLKSFAALPPLSA
jgi:putative hydrolase of the HAD superfamily